MTGRPALRPTSVTTRGTRTAMETERTTNGDVCECDVQGMRLYKTLYIARGRGRRKGEMKRTDADDDCVLCRIRRVKSEGEVDTRVSGKLDRLLLFVFDFHLHLGVIRLAYNREAAPPHPVILALFYPFRVRTVCLDHCLLSLSIVGLSASSPVAIIHSFVSIVHCPVTIECVLAQHSFTLTLQKEL